MDAHHTVFSTNYINITGNVLNHMKGLFIHTFHIYIMLYPVNSNEKSYCYFMAHTYICRMFTVNQELGYEGEGIISRNALHVTTFIVGVIT